MFSTSLFKELSNSPGHMFGSIVLRGSVRYRESSPDELYQSMLQYLDKQSGTHLPFKYDNRGWAHLTNSSPNMHFSFGHGLSTAGSPFFLYEYLRWLSNCTDASSVHITSSNPLAYLREILHCPL